MAEGDAKAGPSSPEYPPWPDYDFSLPWSSEWVRAVRMTWNLGEMKAALTALDLIRTPDEPIVVEH